MADNLPEGSCRASRDDADSTSTLWHPYRLPPMLVGQQRDHNLVTLPSISPYSMDWFPQCAPSTAANSHIVSTHMDANTPLYLPCQSGSHQVSSHEGNGCQRLVRYGDNTVDSSSELSLPALTDRSHHQQVSPYYGHDSLQHSHQSSVGAANYPSPPAQYHLLPLHYTGSPTTYPPPSVQKTSPLISDSPHEGSASEPSPASPAPHRSKRAATYHAKLAAVNGVVTPSKRGPDANPLQPKAAHVRSGGNRPLECLCPICGAAFASNYHVQSHFSACVARNGNPSGARWDDGLRTRARAGRRRGFKRGTRATRRTLLDTQPDVLASPSSHLSAGLISEHCERFDALGDRLDAVGGVVVPSEPEGALPVSLDAKPVPTCL